MLRSLSRPGAALAPLVLAFGTALGLSGLAQAKLPPPSPEAKAKADEAKAKTAHGDKVGAYKLCLAMERTAAHYFASAKTAGKDVKPAGTTPACADPGPFVYTPPEAAPAAAPAPAPTAAAPAAPPKP